MLTKCETRCVAIVRRRWRGHSSSYLPAGCIAIALTELVSWGETMSSDDQFTALGPAAIGFQTNGANIDGERT